MHILRNTGNRIVFHVYNIRFGETSFSKDNKIVNFIILYTKNTFIYVWNKKEYQLCVSLYIFWSLNTRLKNMPISKNYSIQLLKNGGQHGKICLYLIRRDRVFKLIKIYHIFRFKYAMVRMNVWKKSASIRNNSNLCVTFIYVYL